MSTFNSSREQAKDGTANMIRVLCRQKEGLKICHINAQSLLNKIDEFRYIFENSGVDIICVSETWFKSDIADCTISMDGYSVVRVDRNGHGGGVAIYFKRGIIFQTISTSADLDLVEYVLVEVKSSSKILVGAVYRPNKNISLDLFVTKIEAYSIMYNDILIAGDFNSNILIDSNLTDKIIHLGISPINSILPTHFSSTRNTLLDLFLVCDTSKVLMYDQLTASCFSKHDLIFTIYDFKLSIPEEYVTFRDFKNIDFYHLESEFSRIDWNLIYSMLSVEEQVSFLEKNLGYLYNLTVPLRTKKVRHNGRPWFSEEIKKTITQRNIAFTRWKRFKISEFHEIYRRLRKLTNKLIKSAKSKYYANKFSTAVGSKKKWQIIQEIGIGKSCKHVLLDSDADKINENFLNIPIMNTDIEFYQRQHDDATGTFCFTGVSQFDVLASCISITSNAVGIDNVHPKFFKILLPKLLPFVTFIFNKILTTSHFPSNWKKAKIFPIPKSNSEYRPISILTFLSKAFERILHSQMTAFLDANSLLTDRQSGFRKWQSCTTALIDVAEDIRKELDESRLTLLVLLDHSKAFDTVDHSILCAKLKLHFNFCNTATNLIESYLSNRFQYVDLGVSQSTLLPVNRGVPQGSIIGPLLFSMYANDLPNYLHNCNTRMYADDVQLYLSCKPDDIDACVSMLNQDLERINCWASANGLAINPVKSKCLIIGKRSILPTQTPHISLRERKIEIVRTAKNLGVIFNSNLTWSDHINTVCGRVFSMLRNLWQTQHCTPIRIRILLAKTYVMPVLLFGSELFANCDSKSRRKLNVAFNNISRYVYGVKRYDHISNFSQQLYGTNFDNLLKIKVLVFLHKTIFTKQPPHLYKRITFSRSGRGNKINSIKYKNHISEWHFFVHAVRLWNTLPNGTQLLSNAQQFKRNITNLFSS